MEHRGSAEPLAVEMLFVMPDIGGYTQFMLDHKKSPEYAETVIRELMEAMLHENHVHLRISEVEGDALFLYCIKENEAQWEEDKRGIATAIEDFFVAFEARLAKRVAEAGCDCDVCKGIEKLFMKIVVHMGTAVLDRLDRFTTISGVDAIIIHRLLKNSLTGSYLLVTEPAFEACAFPRPERFTPHDETYPDVGIIHCLLYRSSPF